jgi:hypothetical protein
LPTSRGFLIPFLFGSFVLKSLHPNRVEVNVARHFQKIVISINQKGLVPSLIKIAHPVMSMVERGGVGNGWACR